MELCHNGEKVSEILANQSLSLKEIKIKREKEIKAAETKTFTAWVIKTNNPRYLGCIDRYWGFAKTNDVPGKLAGCRVAFFETREAAKRNLQWINASFPWAKVRKARVTIEEIK